MEQYAIKGGNPLVGEVEIGGAKNAALAILAASIMTDETVIIENLPDVRDTNVLMQAMESVGATIQKIDRHSIKVNGSTIHDVVIEDDFIKNANAFLCVFDINDENSVIKAVNIKESYEDKLGEFKKNKKWYLIGNKKDKDLLDKKIPSQYKNRFNNYFEISANTSKDSEFDIILRKIIEELNLQQKENKGIIDDSEMEKENFEIDFETAHGNVFDEECEIF